MRRIIKRAISIRGRRRKTRKSSTNTVQMRNRIDYNFEV